MKTILRATVPCLLLLLAGLTTAAYAGEPSAAPNENALAACDEAEPWSPETFPAWADANGFGEPTRLVAAAVVQCPEIRSCNKTHCITTDFCSTSDLGVGTCCVGSNCRSCPAGQTIQVTNCRCAGGGCVNRTSQSLACG